MFSVRDRTKHILGLGLVLARSLWLACGSAIFFFLNNELHFVLPFKVSLVAFDCDLGILIKNIKGGRRKRMLYNVIQAVRQMKAKVENFLDTKKKKTVMVISLTH